MGENQADESNWSSHDAKESRKELQLQNKNDEKVANPWRGGDQGVRQIVSIASL
jgi:hypothetical protein